MTIEEKKALQTELHSHKQQQTPAQRKGSVMENYPRGPPATSTKRAASGISSLSLL
jgi:hypothetical protein